MTAKNAFYSTSPTNRNSLIATAFLLGLTSQHGSGESISYNFSQNAANQTLDTVTPKGPLQTTFWNDSNAEGAGASGSESGLVNGSGAATSAAISWNSANTWSNGSGTGSQDARIVVGYLDDGGSGAAVTLSNIPYAKYNVYGIVGSDAGVTYTTRDFRVNNNWVFPVFQSQLDNSGSLGVAGDTAANTSTPDAAGALAGSADPAFAFDNTSASVPYSAALNPASFTVDGWVKPSNVDAGSRVIIQSMINGQNPSNSDDRSGWVLRQNDNELTFMIGGTGPIGGSVYYTTTATTTADVLTAGVWQHVAVSYDAGSRKVLLYVNGVQVLDFTAPAPLIPNFAAPIIIGNRGYGGWGFVGSIDELALYPGVLSQATLASHYTNGIDPGRLTTYAALVQASSPLGYWTGITLPGSVASPGSGLAYGTWQGATEQWSRIDPASAKRGNYWRIGGMTGSTCTIQGQATGTGRGSLSAIIIEEAITPVQLVKDGKKLYEEVDLGATLASEFRVGLDMTTVDSVDGFSVASPHSLSVTPQPGVASGTYPLIDYSGSIGGAGFGGISLTPGPNPRYGVTLSNNVANSSVDVIYTPATPIVWTGASSVWDTDSAVNWKLETTSAPTAFYPLDNVKFGDSASTGNVVIKGPVSPISVEIINETLPYAITGDSIAGPGGLTKFGAAALSIATANTFTGPVELFGGTVEISAANNLGAAGSYPLELASTTLRATQTMTLGRKMSILDPVTIQVADTMEVTAPGGFGGGGQLIKTGNGTLRFQNYGGGSFQGSMLISQGTVVMAGGAFNSVIGLSSITVETGATLLQPAGAFHALGGAYTTSPVITLEEGATFTINQENYLETVNMTGATINGSSEIRSDFKFNANIFASPIQSVWSANINGVNSPVTFNVENGPLDVDIALSGAIFNGELVKNGPGTLKLSGINTYTGDTTVNAGILAVNGSAVPDVSDLVIAGGKVAPVGVEVVANLFLGGVEQAKGKTYGASGSGAEIIDDVHFTGTQGVVSVVGATYNDWIAGFPGAASATGFNQDADSDGVPNGVEHVLGTDPSASSSGLTHVSATANSLTFRATLANALATNVAPGIEWSSDLVEWKSSEAANASGTIVTIVVTGAFAGTTPDNLQYELVATATGTPAKKIFVRLVAALVQ
jgi:autotransporter-associated beta strand protein